MCLAAETDVLAIPLASHAVWQKTHNSRDRYQPSHTDPLLLVWQGDACGCRSDSRYGGKLLEEHPLQLRCHEEMHASGHRVRSKRGAKSSTRGHETLSVAQLTVQKQCGRDTSSSQASQTLLAVKRKSQGLQFPSLV